MVRLNSIGRYAGDGQTAEICDLLLIFYPTVRARSWGRDPAKNELRLCQFRHKEGQSVGSDWSYFDPIILLILFWYYDPIDPIDPIDLIMIVLIRLFLLWSCWSDWSWYGSIDPVHPIMVLLILLVRLIQLRSYWSHWSHWSCWSNGSCWSDSDPDQSDQNWINRTH